MFIFEISRDKSELRFTCPAVWELNPLQQRRDSDDYEGSKETISGRSRRLFLLEGVIMPTFPLATLNRHKIRAYLCILSCFIISSIFPPR